LWQSFDPYPNRLVEPTHYACPELPSNCFQQPLRVQLDEPVR
jgi:hypothetical protein